ncbi:MAG: S41 family peptidase [Bacillota bacterium]
MNRFSRIALIFLLLVSVSLVCAGAFFWRRVQANSEDSVWDALRVISYVNMKYPGKVSTFDLWRSFLRTGAINKMLATLRDPYTYYLNAKEYSELQRDLEGSFFGIGVLLNPGGDYPEVMKVFPDTPGEKGGLKVGDEIISINGKNTYRMDGELVAKRIRGPAGTAVVLRIRREENRLVIQKDLRMIRRRIEVPPMEWEIIRSPYDFRIGYLRLYMFNANTSEYMQKALREVKRQKADGIILDMRENPGGLLEQSILVSSMFLPQGVPVVHILQKDGKPLIHYTRNLRIKEWPVAVLVSGHSASAAEIVAGALKDHRAAVLVGTKTYGKGLVQQLIPLNGNNGSALNLTVARYLTAGGHSIDRKGIEPDIYVRNPEKRKPGEDPQKDAAIRALEDQMAKSMGKAG